MDCKIMNPSQRTADTPYISNVLKRYPAYFIRIKSSETETNKSIGLYNLKYGNRRSRGLIREPLELPTMGPTPPPSTTPQPHGRSQIHSTKLAEPGLI